MTFDVLQAYILTDGLDDWVMLGAITQAGVHFGMAESIQDAREITIDALALLLAEGLVEVGEIHHDVGRFHAWGLSPARTVEAIRQLTAVDDPDSWYAAAWINLTERGETVALQLEVGSPGNAH